MSFGKNLQYLRQMHKGMTQEELAEKMNVSRQTISKWEMESAFPEMDKAIALSKLFFCSLDELIREDLYLSNEAYSNFRVENLPPIRYFMYAVISGEPENDALKHMNDWATANGIEKPELIGWDFPFLTQEQINVFHMHGYAAACLIPENQEINSPEIITQASQHYAVITIEEPFRAPFSLIPNAYRTLYRYMEVNSLTPKHSKEAIECFEKTYSKDGITYMDVYIAVNLR